MNLPYNPYDKNSIISYAKQLVGKKLKDFFSSNNEYKINKGSFGQLLEEHYFHYKPNSDSRADFSEAGLELKSTPLKINKKSIYKAKERLVLSIIKYNDIINEDFFESAFWKKNSNLLLIFYLFEENVDVVNSLIKVVDAWEIKDIDLEIIKNDWEYIKRKVNEGKAHELSEGDTFYLGACTKGANSESKRKQPKSYTLAKQRAFSLKQGYLNHIIASLTVQEQGQYGKLIDNAGLIKEKSIEEVVLNKLKPYYGRSVQEIQSEFNIRLNLSAKHFYNHLTKLILGISLEKEIEEFHKADVIIRAIRVEENDRIIESVSFSPFKYCDIVSEIWEESHFFNLLEKKFLFIFYKEIQGIRYFSKACFWNMPYTDILIAQDVWKHTKKIITEGRIVKSISNKGIRKTNFFGKSNNKIAHVRPHAKNSKDTIPLPVVDRLTGAKEYTKHSFWLNNEYVMNKIFLKNN